MTADVERFRDQLCARKTELQALSHQTAGARKAVALDQQSVGRLSRQDALQQQAMANAQETRRRAELVRIEGALDRIASGEFGYCDTCGEVIDARRLAIDPTTVYCVECARG